MKIELIIIAAIVVPLIIGLLLGMLRGSRRATLRLLLVLLCVVLAYCVKDAITVAVLNIDVEGQTLVEAIVSRLPEQYASAGDTLVYIVTLLISVFVFLAAFFAFKLVTWIIVYPICKIFVKKARKKKDGSYGSKHGLIGGVIGLVQGAAVAFVLCIMLNGIFLNVGNVAEAIDGLNASGGTTQQSETTADEGSGNPDGAMTPEETLKLFADYKNSGTCKFVSGLGVNNKAFDLVASMTTTEGKKLTLTGQIDALSGLVNMGKELSELQNMDMVGGLSGTTADKISEIFTKLDEINNGLSEESKDTINTLVQSVAGQLLPEDSNLDLSVIDFKTISFSNEGQVITELNSYKDTDFSSLNAEESKQLATDIVNTVMKSDIILPLLSSNSEFTIGLEGDNYDFAKNVIEEMEQNPESDKNKVEMLKNFFGLNDEQQQPAPEQPSGVTE